MPSFAGEPPRKASNKPPSCFSSLPIELVLEIIPLVPRRYHPVLSCVSKSLSNLVRFPEIQNKRSLLGLDSLYICFIDKSNPRRIPHWFTLRRDENNRSRSRFTSITPPHPLGFEYSSVIAIGPEIYFLRGTNFYSSSFFIFDSRSGTFRRGPDMLVKRTYTSVGFVGEKIYVIGGYQGGDDVIQAESYDLKKQIWEVAPVPSVKGSMRWCCGANVSLDRKVFALSVIDGMICYDTRDGSCESFELPRDKWWRTGVCVIENVMYVYFGRFGLMWFDAKLVLWRIVDGLRGLKKVRSVGMGEYYGKLVVFWKENVSSVTKEIWCRMIALDKRGVGIRGTAEPAQLLGTVPRSFRLQDCLSISD